MERRAFVRSVSMAMFGAAVASEGRAKALDFGRRSALEVPASEIDPHDEEFWSLVREQFPLTRDRAYFNTGGLGASPYRVIDAVKQKLDELEAVSETGRSQELWSTIKDKAAQMFGAEPSEIAFTRNATEGMNIVANGLPLRQGDEVVLTTHEHVGGTLCWLNRQRRDGIIVKTFEPDTARAEGNLEQIERVITSKTRAISISHVTCTTGQRLPVKEICGLAHDRGLWVVLDGAQTIGVFPVNVKDYGCDAYATSGHKWLLGPKGTGLLYVSRDMLDVIRPIEVGAYSNNEYDLVKGTMSYEPTAQRYEYGTVNVPLIAGVGAAIEFLKCIGMENVWVRDQALSTYLIRGLAEIKNVEVLTPMKQDERGAMVTFKMKNIEMAKLQSFLAEKYQLRTRGVGEASLSGLRVSTHIYNNFEEVERVTAGVKEAAKL